MRDDDFAVWLAESHRTRNGGRLGARPRSDARSRCERIEKYEGGLDGYFALDRMKALLDSLTYSRAAERSGVSARHSVPIDGDVVNGTASLRNAANLYRLFCEDCPPNTAKHPKTGGMFARNHRDYLQHAADIAHLDSRQLVTFRSRDRWKGALNLLENGGEVPIYFAVVDEGPMIRFKAWLRHVLLQPNTEDPESGRLLKLVPPKTEGEGLWDGKVSTLYAISGCYELTHPFPMSHLSKLSDAKFIAENYKYSYSLVAVDYDEDLLTPKASDFCEPPARYEALVNRIIRDTALVRRLKRLHDHQCQRCGLRLELADGSGYSEGHHLKPLGRPHDGPDILANILILCPNCHALLDLGAIQLEPGGLRLHSEHLVGDKYLAYHNSLLRLRAT